MSQGQKKSKRIQTLVAKLHGVFLVGPVLICDYQTKRDIAE